MATTVAPARKTKPRTAKRRDVGLTPRPFQWTHKRYHAMGQLGWFDNYRVELVNGEIWHMSPIGDEHWIGTNLVTRAMNHVFPEDRFIVSVQSALRLSDVDEPEPDVAVIEGDLRAMSGVPMTAALMVEVSKATLRRDRTVKAEVYARARIADYWVLDLRGRRLRVFREPMEHVASSTGWRYAHEEVFGADGRVAPLARPGAAVLVAELLP